MVKEAPAGFIKSSQNKFQIKDFLKLPMKSVLALLLQLSSQDGQVWFSASI